MLSFYFEEVYLEMGKEATATFIGHKECYGVQAEDVRREVEKLIASGVRLPGEAKFMCEGRELRIATASVRAGFAMTLTINV